MSSFFAKIISVILHPLFITSYVLLYLMQANPYIFGFSGPKAKGLVIISFVTISFMFPMIAILMMKALGLIKTLDMNEKQERIGPLIVSGLFYMWLYANIRNNDLIPDALSFFILGTTISIFIALLLNSFTKISLHTIAAGGFLAGMAFILYNFTYGMVDIPIPFIGLQFRISDRLVFIMVVLMAGLAGWSRLKLNAHKEDEVYGGYLVGMLAQVIAFRIFF
ncbi:MAG: hypothetical protein IPO92_01460 [Saprospiraceae bacterium]|nr:hypothetical protein [Saprospiraceae bacterium]